MKLANERDSLALMAKKMGRDLAKVNLAYLVDFVEFLTFTFGET